MSKYHAIATRYDNGREGISAPTFQGMGVAEAAGLVMAELSREDIEYATDPARGEYRGFAALHDRMDANMILPFADTDAADDMANYLPFANAVMDEVSRRMEVEAGRGS